MRPLIGLRGPFLALVALVVVSEAGGALAQTSDAIVGERLDRVVARVGDDPIFASDIERVRALGLATRHDGEDLASFERRILNDLIDQRLRLQAVERYDLPPPAASVLDDQIEALEQRLGGADAMARQLQDLGLDGESLRRLLVRQARVLTYIEQRLAPRIFIELEAVRAYYDEVLVPALAQQGTEAPPRDEVEAEIRFVLRELRLDEEIERWTAELRLQSEIDDLYDRPVRPLPPLVLRLDGGG